MRLVVSVTQLGGTPEREVDISVLLPTWLNRLVCIAHFSKVDDFLRKKYTYIIRTVGFQKNYRVITVS